MKSYDEAERQFAIAEQKKQLFLRSMVAGDIIQRDHILNYTIGEFYSEMSLFIEEQRLQKIEWEKLKEKSKR